MENSERFDITNGPSVWDMSLAIFHSCAGHPHFVKIQYRSRGNDGWHFVTDQALLSSITKEGKSDTRYYFEGTSKGPGFTRFKGFIDTSSRKGWLEFIE